MKECDVNTAAIDRLQHVYQVPMLPKTTSRAVGKDAIARQGLERKKDPADFSTESLHHLVGAAGFEL
ncbi:MAG: hypothetical protein Q4B46_01675, partial [Comamonadaceae bacterium]|nr:hypothetical protein [Comamonadaceae bacterium]